jgi:2-desacetyl-2-hydroxyethyl bacteriochlorophyllide A dehydrogenase
MQSRYIVFPEKQKIVVEMEEVAPPAPDQILCRAEKSLVSIGTESFCLRGIFDAGTNWADWVKYPFRPGYSMSARVVAVGDNIKTFRVGERIATWVPHQQYFSIPEIETYKIPDGVSDEEATWAILATTTQLAARRAQLQLGETVGLVGLGILGQLVTQYIYIAGARRIIAIDPVPMRLDMARTHGATHTLAMDAAQARAEIENITDGKMLDVVFDITGHPAALAQCLQLLRPMGRLILLGDSPTPTQQHLGPGVVSNSLSILGIHAYARPMRGDAFTPWGAHEIVELFFDYLLQKRMRVDDLITHRVSPQQAPEIYTQLQRDRSSALGIIFDWTTI